MVHLIDKDALVAEIEKKIMQYEVAFNNPSFASYEASLIAKGKYRKLLDIRQFINTLEVKEVPIWEKVSPDTGQTTLYQCGEKCFLERDGYRIDLKDLDKLPKKNSTHRTPADIEAAMQEVEEKSEAYTDAHRGERDDDVLSQMRGEPVSEELEEAAKKHAKCQREDDLECGYDLTKLESFIAGAKWKEEQFEKNRLKHCNSITNEQAELEQKFLDEHIDKYNRMPTFLDAIEYGMELKNRAKEN